MPDPLDYKSDEYHTLPAQWERERQRKRFIRHRKRELIDITKALLLLGLVVLIVAIMVLSYMTYLENQKH